MILFIYDTCDLRVKWTPVRLKCNGSLTMLVCVVRGTAELHAVLYLDYPWLLCPSIWLSSNMTFGVGRRGRRDIGPETNSDHLPWRIRTTSLENSANNPGEFGSILGRIRPAFLITCIYI